MKSWFMAGTMVLSVAGLLGAAQASLADEQPPCVPSPDTMFCLANCFGVARDLTFDSKPEIEHAFPEGSFSGFVLTGTGGEDVGYFQYKNHTAVLDENGNLIEEIWNYEVTGWANTPCEGGTEICVPDIVVTGDSTNDPPPGVPSQPSLPATIDDAVGAIDDVVGELHFQDLDTCYSLDIGA